MASTGKNSGAGKPPAKEMTSGFLLLLRFHVFQKTLLNEFSLQIYFPFTSIPFTFFYNLLYLFNKYLKDLIRYFNLKNIEFSVIILLNLILLLPTKIPIKRSSNESTTPMMDRDI